MNIGERDEVLTKLGFIYKRDRGIDNIKSVSVGDKECKTLPDSIHQLSDLLLLNDEQLIAIAKHCGCYKSPNTHKADVIINGVGLSLKSMRGAPPSILNHTSRFGLQRVCSMCKEGTQSVLDYVVREYHQLRRVGDINEDIHNDLDISPFRQHKDELKEFINYFVFKGTGSKDSIFPAQYVVDIDDPFDVSTWKVYDESNFVDANWDKFVFSLRSSKGMGKYPNVAKERKD